MSLARISVLLFHRKLFFRASKQRPRVRENHALVQRLQTSRIVTVTTQMRTMFRTINDCRIWSWIHYLAVQRVGIEAFEQSPKHCAGTCAVSVELMDGCNSQHKNYRGGNTAWTARSLSKRTVHPAQRPNRNNNALPWYF